MPEPGRTRLIDDEWLSAKRDLAVEAAPDSPSVDQLAIAVDGVDTPPS